MAHSALASSHYMVLQARAKHAVHPSSRCAAPHCCRTALQGPAAARGQQCRPQVPPLALSAPCLRGCASGGTDSAGGPPSALVVKNWSVSVTCRHQRGRQGAQQVERPFKAVPAHTPTTSRHLSTSLNDAIDATGRVRGSGATGSYRKPFSWWQQLKCRPKVAGPLLPCHAALRCAPRCAPTSGFAFFWNLRRFANRTHICGKQGGNTLGWVESTLGGVQQNSKSVGGQHMGESSSQAGRLGWWVGAAAGGPRQRPGRAALQGGGGGVHYSPRRGTG